jgi:hypothetical protein
VDHSGACKLGYRAIRISYTSTGEQGRLSGHEPRTAQDPSGGHNIIRLRAVRIFLHEGRLEAGLFVVSVVHRGRGFFHVPWSISKGLDII